MTSTIPCETSILYQVLSVYQVTPTSELVTDKYAQYQLDNDFWERKRVVGYRHNSARTSMPEAEEEVPASVMEQALTFERTNREVNVNKPVDFTDTSTGWVYTCYSFSDPNKIYFDKHQSLPVIKYEINGEINSLLRRFLLLKGQIVRFDELLFDGEGRYDLVVDGGNVSLNMYYNSPKFGPQCGQKGALVATILRLKLELYYQRP